MAKSASVLPTQHGSFNLLSKVSHKVASSWIALWNTLLWGLIQCKQYLNYVLLLPIEDLDQSVEITDAFKIFDRDGNGYIDAKEFKQVVTRMGNCLTNAEADEFMLEADLNGDGKLDFNEFMQMMLKSLSDDWNLKILLLFLAHLIKKEKWITIITDA